MHLYELSVALQPNKKLIVNNGWNGNTPWVLGFGRNDVLDKQLIFPPSTQPTLLYSPTRKLNLTGMVQYSSCIHTRNPKRIEPGL
jgi:hypothetical protein